MEGRDVTDGLGALLKVEELSFADWPEATSALKLSFENGELYNECLADSDELSCSTQLLEDYAVVRDVTDAWLWRRAVNRPVRWLWQLTNQQGYGDGLQYSFAAPGDDQEEVIQLLAIASRIEILQVGRERQG